MNRESSKELFVRAVPIADAHAEEGESPLWDSTIGLRWVDTMGQRMFTLGLDGQETSVALSSRATAIELAPAPHLLAVTTSGFGWLEPQSGRIDPLLTVLSDETISMNDGGIDARGRCWAGSAGRDRPCRSWRGALYRLEGRDVTLQVPKIGLSNGIDWSPVGEVLYHVDSRAGTLTAWEYELASGQLGASRVLRSIPAEVGLPDGLTVDVDGNVWLAVCGAGQVWRIDPKTGCTTGVVEVPTPWITSCTFGGPQLATLYITTANYHDAPGGGLLYVAEVPARGRPARRFTGALQV